MATVGSGPAREDSESVSNPGLSVRRLVSRVKVKYTFDNVTSASPPLTIPPHSIDFNAFPVTAVKK